MQNDSKATRVFGVSREEIKALVKSTNSETFTKWLLHLMGIFLTPITLMGMLGGYRYSFKRIGFPKGEKPILHDDGDRPIYTFAMIAGAVAVWAVIGVAFYFASDFMKSYFGRRDYILPTVFFIGFNLMVSIVIMRNFQKWQAMMNQTLTVQTQFGSAAWGNFNDFSDLHKRNGIYVGGGDFAYSKHGHCITVGGARSGKLTTLIGPYILGRSNYSGSMFCVDIKGELAAISARYQRKIGNKVLILDPWGVNPGKSSCYNPLDLVSGETNPDALIDNVSVIAEMIVPKSNKGDDYWNSRARSVISTFLIHLVTSEPKAPHTLGELWRRLRLPENEFMDLLSSMAASENEIVAAGANEIVYLIEASEKAWGSILSTALDKTDFLKSPALRKSLESSTFDIKELSDGKTTLYVIIPPDQLEAQSQWLRLVFTTALRAVIRARTNKRITFLIDECAALGYLPELKTAFATYAGYNVTMWPIFQDLSQVKSLYGDAWETFISNATVRQFLGINDELTSAYLERQMGVKTVVTYDDGKPSASARPLATADEIRRGSKDNIFVFVEQRPPTYFPKQPYYEMPELYDRHDANPFYNA
ncbi:hypothetical protein A4D02_30825 [Niastella koreensis]|uniref:TRAG family protein n=2 Tax=Niastella koreensis TaxID=354356 RepID=G8T8Y5_NIAKG|nr:type IV secretory system conjugative DNA transfer family protein [Niastella koreensis]AEW02342.1 TRAG family protein [Niastella koreensis GR20-10]OQP46437.1 hypothetical protein A4D02_30825 [Niastella koreensis]